jgi:hypothetical protein
MSVCRATKANGEPCTLPAKTQQGLCWAHDPANREKRRKTASRGGKAKANRDLADVKGRLRALAEDVLSGAVDKGVGAVVSTIWGVYLRAVSTELAVKEQLELIERLENLEEALEKNQANVSRGGYRYGA